MSDCCDDYGNCNQGRDCPVRVAKYRPVMRAADPLPASMWRVYVNYLARWMLLSFLGLLWFAFLGICVHLYAN
jgi:hypothetical protein